MATRKETQERRERLRARLIEACRGGEMKANQPLPPMRELARESLLSVNGVCDIVGELAEAGVLHTIHGLGTFPGRAPESGQVFLGLFPADVERRAYFSAVRAGWEERISALGGASLVLNPTTANRYRERGELPELAGVFEFSGEAERLVWNADIPHVRYGSPLEAGEEWNTVSFDDAGGGEQATRHLLGLGHRHIAFLGLHDSDDDGIFAWSQTRESGWKSAMEAADLDVRGLSFGPAHSRECDGAGQSELAYQGAKRLVKEAQISAVVAVNARAAHGLFRALREDGREAANWPAVVGFDSELVENVDAAPAVVTTLLLPWKDIGREAANLLWERRQQRGGETQHRLVAMNLIRRFSCRADWERAPGAATLGTIGNVLTFSPGAK